MIHLVLRKLFFSFVFLILYYFSTTSLTSCQGKREVATAENATTLFIDGSSTVYPITSEIINQYKQNHNDLFINLSVSGTGGGFNKFCKGETSINNASRKITEDEIRACKANNIKYVSFELAYDGITIVVNPNNDWVNDLTSEDLKLIFGKPKAVKWSDVKDGWPDEPIKCYGPGEASGTYDFFKEVVLSEGSFRDDFIASENDNLLVLGIENNKNAIGYFGHSYYEANKAKLKPVSIDNGNGPVLPSIENIGNGSYTPLSRPLYIYVNKAFVDEDPGLSFIKFYLEKVGAAALLKGNVALSKEKYKSMIKSLEIQ